MLTGSSVNVCYKSVGKQWNARIFPGGSASSVFRGGGTPMAKKFLLRGLIFQKISLAVPIGIAGTNGVARRRDQNKTKNEKGPLFKIFL